MKKLMLVLALGAILLVARSASAAVTLNVPGDYGDLASALDHLGDGDGDDTIIVKADQTISSRTHWFPKNGGNLLIKAETPGTKIVGTNALADGQMFWARGVGNTTFDGFTFVAPPAPVGEMMRTFFLVEHSDLPTGANHKIELTVKNCILTGNDGSDNPILNYSTATVPNQFRRWFQTGDNNMLGPIVINVENSTLAMARVEGVAGVRPTPITDASYTFNLTNSLVIGSNQNFFKLYSSGIPMALNIDNSLLAGCAEELLRASDGHQNIAITITDSVIGPSGSGSSVIMMEDEFGPISIKNSTIIGDGDPAIAIYDYYMVDESAAIPSFTMENVIIPEAGFYFEVPITTVDFKEGFQVGALSSSGNDDVDAAAMALYEGAGPFTDDPMFVSTDLSVLDGKAGWFKTTNTLYDVGNITFKGKGTQAGEFMALLGGGNGADGVPVELSSFQVE